MGKLFWEKAEIPIPDDAYVNNHDGRVFIMFIDGNGLKRRRVIGHATSTDTMTPNEMFRSLYPTIWEEHYGTKDLKEMELSLGMYALTLGIGISTTLYPLIQEVYGLQSGNAIMDYAMYSLMYRDNTTQLYPERMKTEILFSQKIYSDAWYSERFVHYWNNNMHHEFRLRWLQHCKDMGVKRVWVSIDGSNNDCEVVMSEMCEFGEPKSHNKNKKIVSYMYAVDAETGRPITYRVYEGGTVDSTAFHEIAKLLYGAGIEIEGVILDRGFCTNNVIETIRECGFQYVIMMHQNHFGHTQMLDEYSDKIFWNPEYIVNDEIIFGVSARKQLFREYDTEAYVHLMFDGVRGSYRSIEYARKVREEVKRLNAQIEKGIEPKVNKAYKNLIEVQTTVNGTEVICHYDQWKRKMIAKGYHSLACSENYGVARAIELYELRSASEIQYCILKSQEGFHTTRVHSSPGIQSKFAVAFISSILRAEIQIACKQLGLDTNVMIRKMDRIHAILVTGNQYVYSKRHSPDHLRLLEIFGITEKHLDKISNEVNQRMDLVVKSQVHRIPSLDVVPQAKRKSGRKKGSKNKATIEREKKEAIQPSSDQAEKKPKNKGGRPKGRKDSYPRKRRTKAEIERSRSSNSN